MATHEYNGNVSASALPDVSKQASFNYSGNVPSSAVPSAVKIVSFVVSGNVPSRAVPSVGSVYSQDIPYAIQATVIIDGSNEAKRLYGTMNIEKGSNQAGQFSISLSTSTVGADLLEKEIILSFAAADEDGDITQGEQILIGKIRNTEYQVESDTLQLSGYDYGGVHNTLGERLSTNVHKIKTGTIGINTSGTHSTGKTYIFDVAVDNPSDTEENNPEDGTDYFVDQINGDIYVPVNSKLIGSDFILSYRFAKYFNNIKEMLDKIAGYKGWTLSEESGAAIEDYDATTDQPLVYMDNDSVIELLKKFYELSGSKLDTSLFPILRVYNEVTNFDGSTVNTHNTSSIYIETVNVNTSHDNLLTNQTVESVIDVYQTIDVDSDFQEALDKSDETLNEELIWFIDFLNDVEGGNAYNEAQAKYNDTISEKQRFYQDAKFNISSANVSDTQITVTGNFRFSFVAGQTGTTYGSSAPSTFKDLTLPKFSSRSWSYTDISSVETEYTSAITSGDWVTDIADDGDLEIKLKKVAEWIEYPYITNNTNKRIHKIFYPAAEFDLTVSIKEIDYGEPTNSELISVDAEQTIDGISVTLEGDVIQHPYAKKQEHLEAFVDSIMFSHGHKYTSSYQIPLHKATNLKLGQKTVINTIGSKSITGVLTKINYRIDLSTGSGIATLTLYGDGTNL